MENRKQFDIIIVGAGFAGLGMAIRLKQLGEYSFTILEKANHVGGTWRDNTYPGAACDVPSHLYSYSFEPYPEWTRMFAPQKEILDYIDLCVEKYRLSDHIRYNQEVNEVRFQEESGTWVVKTAAGEEYESKFMIGATGPLNKVKLPDIPGFDQFKGKVMHTAEWDHGYEVKGKNVAVIGTGASAIQVVPSIVPEVKGLKLFQRTPPWIMPRPDRPISDAEREKFRKKPSSQLWQRFRIYWILEVRAFGFVKAPGVMKWAENFVRKYLERKVKDPELRKKLTPQYTMGCKRILLSSDYYPSLAEDHVEVVTNAIDKITEDGLVTKDGSHYPVDAIICATGFTASESMSPFPIIGRNGVNLAELWANGGEAYLGTAISGFPNSFIIVGPNTGLGHNSMIHIIESQINYIEGALKALKKKGAKWADVKKKVQDDYNAKVQKRMSGTVWNVGGCMSWYLNSEGKNTTLWPGFTFEFRRKTKRFKLKDYELEY